MNCLFGCGLHHHTPGTFNFFMFQDQLTCLFSPLLGDDLAPIIKYINDKDMEIEEYFRLYGSVQDDIGQFSADDVNANKSKKIYYQSPPVSEANLLTLSLFVQYSKLSYMPLMLKVNHRIATPENLREPGKNKHSLYNTCVKNGDKGYLIKDEAELTPLSTHTLQAFAHTYKVSGDKDPEPEKSARFQSSFAFPLNYGEKDRVSACTILQKKLSGDFLYLHHLLFTMLAFDVGFESYKLSHIMSKLFEFLSSVDLKTEEGRMSLLTEERLGGVGDFQQMKGKHGLNLDMKELRAIILAVCPLRFSFVDGNHRMAIATTVPYGINPLLELPMIHDKLKLRDNFYTNVKVEFITQPEVNVCMHELCQRLMAASFQVAEDLRTVVENSWFNFHQTVYNNLMIHDVHTRLGQLEEDLATFGGEEGADPDVALFNLMATDKVTWRGFMKEYENQAKKDEENSGNVFPVVRNIQTVRVEYARLLKDVFDIVYKTCCSTEPMLSMMATCLKGKFSKQHRETLHRKLYDSYKNNEFIQPVSIMVCQGLF